MRSRDDAELPGVSSRVMNRRRFLRVSAAGAAAAALLAALGPGKALAQRDASLVSEFREAAERYRVPAPLLMAMGYVNTRWEMPPPETNEYEAGDLHGWGAYGIMALVQNPSANTLGEASRLTGIPEESLKTDRRSNIMGGAALLASSQGRGRPARLDGWLGAVDGGGGDGKTYRAVAGVGSGRLYAEQVRATLMRGAQATISGREPVSLPAQSLESRAQGPREEGGEL